MCSSRVAIVALALAARTLPAIAQPAPAGPPPVDDPPPTEAPAAGPVAPPPVDPAPIEAEPSPPVATEPPPVAVQPPPPPPSPPPVAPPPPPTPGAARGPVFGLEVGVGVTPGGDGLFGPGTGKAFMLGYRADRWTFEFRFGESYDQPASNARLADAGVRGPLRSRAPASVACWPTCRSCPRSSSVAPASSARSWSTPRWCDSTASARSSVAR